VCSVYVSDVAKSGCCVFLSAFFISGFRRDVDEICALLGYYAASCDNCLPTFRDNISVPSSRVKNRTLDP
jgi:hypothetical protein